MGMSCTRGINIIPRPSRVACFFKDRCLYILQSLTCLFGSIFCTARYGYFLGFFFILMRTLGGVSWCCYRRITVRIISRFIPLRQGPWHQGANHDHRHEQRQQPAFHCFHKVSILSRVGRLFGACPQAVIRLPDQFTSVLYQPFAESTYRNCILLVSFLNPVRRFEPRAGSTVPKTLFPAGRFPGWGNFLC